MHTAPSRAHGKQQPRREGSEAKPPSAISPLYRHPSTSPLWWTTARLNYGKNLLQIRMVAPPLPPKTGDKDTLRVWYCLRKDRRLFSHWTNIATIVWEECAARISRIREFLMGDGEMECGYLWSHKPCIITEIFSNVVVSVTSKEYQNIIKRESRS